MNIVQMIIPATKKTRPGILMNPKYITVHETDNTAKGANALAHAKLQQKGNDRLASWHYSVDDGDTIYQSIPDNEIAWHAGDGSHGTGNLESLSMELCVNSDGNFTKTKENGIWLLKYLMNKHNIPLSNVVPHQHWSGKDCPHNILKSGWNQFLAPLKEKVPYPGNPLKLGDRGDNVKAIQNKLGGLVVDGNFGLKTEASVKHFQQTLNLVVDGVVGPQTWNALFR